MGAKYKGYTSDLSRTVFVGENNFLEEEYNFVLEKQKFISKNFKDGVNIKQVLKQVEEAYARKKV